MPAHAKMAPRSLIDNGEADPRARPSPAAGRRAASGRPASQLVHECLDGEDARHPVGVAADRVEGLLVLGVVASRAQEPIADAEVMVAVFLAQAAAEPALGVLEQYVSLVALRLALPLKSGAKHGRLPQNPEGEA